MAVTTRLTWNEERSLQKLLGNHSLSLLYKSSVHKDGPVDMTRRCSHQGSTVTVIYFTNSIIGIFMLEDFPKLDENSANPRTSFCFSFQKKNLTTIPFLFLNMPLKMTSEGLEFYLSPDRLFFVNPRRSKLNLHYSIIEELGFNFPPCSTYLECEIFRVEGIKNDPGYIRKITTVARHRNELLREFRAYKPHADLVPEVRILLLGPVGSGKSSFFNSVKSVFQGHVTRQATVGCDDTSITEQYRIYSVKDGKDGQYLSFMLCDSMGLDEMDEEGLCEDDISHILKGHVPDRYQFNPCRPITSKHPAFITSPLLKDRIHCVAYVLDINSINNLSYKMVAKFKRIHKEVLSCGVAQVALLTKVNNCDEVLQDDFLNMDRSMTSQSQVMSVNKMFHIPFSNILMVGNYASERELDPMRDVLILSALMQMLRAADNFLENLPLEETASN